MDKYDIVLDIVGHPERYSAEKLAEILSDPETREIYELLCGTVSSAKEPVAVDVDEQWQLFASRHLPKPSRIWWFGSRAASIVALLTTSLVAVAIGVAVTVSKSESNTDSSSSITEDAATVAVADTIGTAADSVPALTEPVMFENVALRTIMDEVAKTYGVEVNYNNASVSQLHLYYRFDPGLALDDIIGQLNNFEQINISRDGNTLSID